ncbi:GmrSD restriction endonuclease domain-containing protein [Rivularia sp. UHCC 0363]|uniref:GmrSD restriction endonuclease domain-containing protein n=1 Tax=Rivularia sp. UHCC 0363 TaxID=3110244 RepID=UPI002B20653D|nr:DUF262 domain-containing protein [Rivularia sp. UHCC 0363]MEA5595140.1 DUF262 domain-containing protein [Rivularia sp. UHCC 0363]
MPVKNFDHTTESLQDLLQTVKKGKTQLPDFQRAWVWSDEQICSILASISLSYPVGVVMMLQTGNDNVRFQERLIEGVTLKDSIKPERLILDGQQRITSLFQSLLLNQPAKTKDARGKEIKRWYYIDIEKALNPSFDRESAVISLPENKIIHSFGKEVLADYSTVEKEYQNGLFPVAQIFNCSDWMCNYNEFWDYDREKIKLFNQFNQEVIKPFEQYHVPIISLRQETPREAVCQVFEKVNTGGVSLTVFELLTATFAVDKFQLREDWETRKNQLQQLPVLSGIASTDFLQAVTLLVTRDRPSISCTRKDILKLTLTEYKDWADKVTEGFKKAAKLLHTQKIFTAIDLPYQPQLTVLAAIFAVLEEDTDPVLAKLVRWYWCGVFGEIYSGAIESRMAKDLPQVLQWIQADDDSEPDTITDANFSPNRLLGLKTRRSAAYKGLSALLLRDKGCDFLTGYEIDTLMNFGDAIDIHHIFPRKWCEKNGIEARLFDSVINKAPLSSRTNKIIGSKAPSTYLSKLQEKANISEQRMDDILQSHAINPDNLRSDNFQAFFNLRQEALLDRIETAMGKTILRAESVEST